MIEVIPQLTPREVVVYDLLLQDLIIKEIALKLERSEKTIGSQAERIYAKFGVRGRIGLFLKVLGPACLTLPTSTAQTPRP